MFVDSQASRLIQLADHVAYAVFRRYNASDTTYFDIIASKFHSSEGVVHGLSHKQLVDPACMCVACLSRRRTFERTEKYDEELSPKLEQEDGQKAAEPEGKPQPN